MSMATLGLVESTVRDALVRFEPRIEVLKIMTSPDEAVTGKLVVDIEYRVRDSNRRDNLVYNFYLRGNS
jgi:phage baseplate assembly protein W